MQFNFDREVIYNGSIDISDIGNFSIKATTDECMDYYFITNTSLGLTEIFTYGPVIPDIDYSPQNDFCSNYFQVEYDEKAINKIINKWINSNGIKYIEEVSIGEALDSYPDIIKYMKDIVGEQ